MDRVSNLTALSGGPLLGVARSEFREHRGTAVGLGRVHRRCSPRCSASTWCCTAATTRRRRRRALVESAAWIACGLALLRRGPRAVRRQGLRRVHERLRHREVAQRRQRLRVGDHLRDVRDPAALSAPRPVLGHLRRAGAARRSSSSPGPRSSSSSGGCSSCSARSSSCRASRWSATRTTRARTGTTAR